MSECLLASSIGVALLDENYRYLELNEALARIHGVRREVSKESCMAELLPVVWAALKPIVERVLSTGESVSSVQVSGNFCAQPGCDHCWLVSIHTAPKSAASRAALILLVSDLTEHWRLGEIISPRGRLVSIAQPSQPAASRQRSVDGRGLSNRQTQVLALIGSGRTSKEVATSLGLSTYTIREFRKALCRKLGLHSAAELVAFAAHHGSRAEIHPSNQMLSALRTGWPARYCPI